jgi:hypothetical protein
MAYEQVAGPIGEHRYDVLAALISYRVVSALTDSKDRKLTLNDFLPRWGTTAEEVGLGDVQEPADPPGSDR